MSIDSPSPVWRAQFAIRGLIPDRSTWKHRLASVQKVPYLGVSTMIMLAATTADRLARSPSHLHGRDYHEKIAITALMMAMRVTAVVEWFWRLRATALVQAPCLACQMPTRTKMVLPLLWVNWVKPSTRRLLRWRLLQPNTLITMCRNLREVFRYSVHSLVALGHLIGLSHYRFVLSLYPAKCTTMRKFTRPVKSGYHGMDRRLSPCRRHATQFLIRAVWWAVWAKIITTIANHPRHRCIGFHHGNRGFIRQLLKGLAWRNSRLHFHFKSTNFIPIIISNHATTPTDYRPRVVLATMTSVSRSTLLSKV